MLASSSVPAEPANDGSWHSNEAPEDGSAVPDPGAMPLLAAATPTEDGRGPVCGSTCG